jgi:hypothetical protein
MSLASAAGCSRERILDRPTITSRVRADRHWLAVCVQPKSTTGDPVFGTAST